MTYEFGEGATKDYKLAISWYTKAADQGNDDAQYNLGLMYYDGKGVTQGHEQAAYWFGNAAVQGNADAQVYLGYMYSSGEGVTKDYKQAEYWYRKAVAQGNDYAENNLGYMYHMGYGVNKDYKQAEYWYRKAADQGNINAQNNLGEVYDTGGEGVVQDYEKALYWYRKAADQGGADAQNNLGKMYENAKGVAQDYIQALSWYRIAADQKNDEAKKNFESLESLIEAKAKFDDLEAYVAKAKKKAEAAYMMRKTEVAEAKNKSEADKAYIEKISQDTLKLENENEKLIQESLQLKADLVVENDRLDILKTVWKTKDELARYEINKLNQTSVSKNLLISNLKSENEELEKRLSSATKDNEKIMQESLQLAAEIVQQLQAKELLIDNHLNILKSTYINNIAESVKREWNYQGAKDDWVCDVRLIQDEKGVVKEVDINNCIIDESYRETLFIKSIEKAILKASPLQVAPDKSVFESEIKFQFKAY